VTKRVLLSSAFTFKASVGCRADGSPPTRRQGGVQGSIETRDIRILRRRTDGSIETIVFDARHVFVAAVTVPQLKPGDQVIVK
jgi:hypothetical protein